jgi:hypothetical protein
MLFTSVIYSFYLFIMFTSGKQFLIGNRDPAAGLITAALLMYVAHSVMVGHALSSPVPTTLITGYIAVFLTSTTTQKKNS